MLATCELEESLCNLYNIDLFVYPLYLYSVFSFYLFFWVMFFVVIFKYKMASLWSADLLRGPIQIHLTTQNVNLKLFVQNLAPYDYGVFMVCRFFLFRFLLFVCYYLLVYWSLVIFNDQFMGRIKVCGSYMLVAKMLLLIN